VGDDLKFGDEVIHGGDDAIELGECGVAAGASASRLAETELCELVISSSRRLFVVVVSRLLSFFLVLVLDRALLIIDPYFHLPLPTSFTPVLRHVFTSPSVIGFLSLRFLLVAFSYAYLTFSSLLYFCISAAFVLTYAL
jgi:hypothetical protein